MMIIHLAFKDLVSEPKHLLSYILTIGSLIAVVVIPLAIGNAYIEYLTRIMPAQDYHHYLVINSSASSLSDSVIEYRLLEDILRRRNVDSSPQLTRYCKVSSNAGEVETVFRGANLNHLYKFRRVNLHGSTPRNMSEANIGVLLAGRLNVSVDDYIEIVLGGGRHVLRVAGILRCSCPYDEEVLVQLEDAWRMSPDADGKITFLEFTGRLDDGEFASLNLRVMPVQPASQAIEGIVESTFNTIRSWALAISIAVFVSSYFTSLKMCIDSLDRVLVLRSIGFSKKKAALFLFYKALIVSLMSLLVGVSVGIVSSQVIFRALSLILSVEAYQPPTLTLNDLCWVSAAAGTISITGSIPSIIRIARMKL